MSVSLLQAGHLRNPLSGSLHALLFLILASHRVEPLRAMGGGLFGRTGAFLQSPLSARGGAVLGECAEGTVGATVQSVEGKIKFGVIPFAALID